MTHMGRRLVLLLLAVVLGCASGCLGGSHNPSYFPHLVPFGDVIKTHAKPVGPSYYANFDPHASELIVEPMIQTCQVGTQLVLLATVKDAKDTPRRSRRIDWIVTGGNLVEVDESGYLPGRGGIEGNRGFSYTSYGEDRLSRGNSNKADDIIVRPGQSWCIVSSPVEGDTHVQVVAPGIHNMDKRMKTALIRWVDATWEFPARAIAKYGTEHEFTTKVARHTDRLPLANYRVRYKILDGPPAILLPSRAQEDTVVTDLRGMGKIRIAQLAPASGVNRVSVEIVRPPDPTTPSGTGVPIVMGETSVEWLAPDVRLSHTGPAAALLGSDIVFTTVARNDGRLQSESLELVFPVPEGLDFVGSQPPADARNGQVVIPFGVLAVGQAHTVQTTFKCKRPGAVKSVVLMKTAEGQNDQKEANVLVTTPGLTMEIIAPKTGLVDVPINYSIRLSNPGTGDLDEIQLIAEFDKGLDHDKMGNAPNDKTKNLLSTKVAGLKAGSSRDETLILTPRRPGPLNLQMTAASAGLKQVAGHVVLVQQPKVSMRVDGPAQRYVGRPVEWKIFVKNDSEAEMSGVVVRDRLPAEVRYAFANRNGNHVAGEVTWNLGTLRAGEEVALELTGECQRANAAADNVVLFSADGNVRAEKSSRLKIDGIAALKTSLIDLNNPVEVGKNALYRMTITNTGSAPTSRIELKAIVSELMKPIRATGPTRETVAGRLITFDKVDNLQPGQTITFQFECEALKDGDARFRVEYTSDLNAAPLIEEQATRVIAPFAAPLPPPPPGGGKAMPLPPG